MTNWSHEASTPEGVPLPSYRYERETKSCPKLSLRRNNSDTRVTSSSTFFRSATIILIHVWQNSQ
ncbi:hypothetical protein CKK01_10355 [Acinetobacter baumannii]|nr:hypothetical protein [Acinetobacter baumannii]